MYADNDVKMIDHRSYAHDLAVVEVKPEKKLGLNGIRTPRPQRYRCSVLPAELSSQL